MHHHKLLMHAMILSTCVMLSFLWQQNESLSYFSLQVTGILLIVLILSHHFLKPNSFKLVESTVSTIAVLLVTSSTGGLSSPFFFLNYLLLFELSLLLSPALPLFLSGILILYYFFSTGLTSSFISLAELAAFPLMTPFAYFLGQMYEKVRNQKKEIRSLASEVRDLKEELMEEEIRLHPTASI